MSTNQNTEFQVIAQKLNAQWDAAFNAKDAEKVAAFYDAAGSVLPAGAAQVIGVTDIAQFWISMIGQGIVDHRIELSEAAAGDSLAFQRGKWSAAVIDASGERQTFSGHLQLVYRRQADSSWKILSHIWNM